jgi:hypothetical protein
MHAVVVNVTINDDERALSELRENIVPNVSQIPGFVTGYWTRKDNGGRWSSSNRKTSRVRRASGSRR